MKHKLLQFSSSIAALVFMVVFFGLAIANTPTSGAVKATDFKAGRIIDDNVFYNSGTMSVAKIQSFMDSTLPACDMWGTKKIGYGYYINGKAVDPNITRAAYAKKMRTEGGDSRYHDPPYVCINKYYENPTTHVNNFSTKGEAKSGMISAAQIVYDAAKEYNINPQVLLVMLKKESYAWGDDWPTKNEYNTVMGYACPDNAACNKKYYGFYNQVNMAAWQLDYYKKHIYSYNYRPYVTNKIYYNPSTSCGSKQVYIENYATASLYIYTPYTPNAASLKNYPGTAKCGSYGNRNFFMYFNEWFGSTLFTAKEASVLDDSYYIYSNKDKTKYMKSVDGIELTAKNALGNYGSFVINKNSDGSYKIINSANLAFDAGTSPEEGKTISLTPVDDTLSSQKWIIYDSGSGTYSFSPKNNKTIALTYDESSNSFKFSTYTKAAWQKFIIEKYQANNTVLVPDSNQTPTESESVVTTEQPLTDGTYSLVSTLNNTSAISLKGDKTTNDTKIHLWSITNKPSQKYTIKYDKKSGTYTLKNTLSGKYLAASSTTVKNNTLAVIYGEKNNCTQKWKILKNSDNTFTVASTCNDNYVLDIAGGQTANGTTLQLYKTNNSKAQKFNFIKYEGSSLNGDYYIQSNTNPNYVVDIAGTSFTSGKNIQLYKGNGDKTQRFAIKFISDCKCYSIVSANANYSIDVAGGNKANGTNIQLYKNNSTNSQRWYITKYTDGTYRIRSVGTGKMFNLNANKISNGTNINLWQDGNANSQKWKLKKVD